MICHAYKNGNITIKHEPFYDGKVTEFFEHFPAWIAEHEDFAIFDTYEVGDFENWGNSYGAYYMKIFVDGELGYYPVTPDDYEHFRQGYTVRLRRESLAPLFTLPSFYKEADYELDGTKGHVYWMCDPLTDEQRDAMGWNGVVFLKSRPQYAPEMVRDVVFVPNGMHFEFC